jgi:hypothetical protein
MSVVLAAVGVAAGSGASFSASSSNPSNTFTSGTLSMSNNKSGAAVLTVSNMKPGDTQSGTVDIENTGSLSGTFSMTASNITNGGNASPSTYPMAGKLNLTIADCGTFVGATAPSCPSSPPASGNIYQGTLAAFSGNKSLGTFSAGEKHRYIVFANFDASADNNYQSATSSVDFTWNAVS